MGAKKPLPDKLLTAEQATEIFNEREKKKGKPPADVSTIRRWCRDGLLLSESHDGRDHIIRLSDLQRFERPVRGRPSKKI